MSTYVESKKELDKIRNDFGCQGEIIFRTALQYVMEYGQTTFQRQAWVKEQLIFIDAKHDEAEQEGRHLFVARDVEKAIIECAEALAKVNTYDLLVYVQKEMWLGADGIDYKKTIDMLKRCMSCIEEQYEELPALLKTFEYIGFTDDELEEFGYGYLFDVIEDDEL